LPATRIIRTRFTASRGSQKLTEMADARSCIQVSELRVESALAEKTKPDRLAGRQIRSAVDMVGEARRVLRDERHRLFQASSHTAMAVIFVGPMINC
jgi:hypothetical protein